MKLYHFTNINALNDIINTGMLFFSNLEFANDPTEGSYQQKAIETSIREISNRKRYECNINNLVAAFNRQTTKNEILNLYSMSFSSSLLNIHNWVEYADKCQGVAIEFDYDRLKDLIKKSLDFLTIESVEYEEKKLIFRVEKILDKHLLDNDIIDCCIDLKKLYPFYKNEVYFVEYEYRIAFVSDELQKDFKDCNNIVYNNIELPLLYWCPRFEKYVLNFKMLIDNGIIKSIYINSKMNNDTKQQIKNLVDSRGCTIGVNEVLIPWRRK